MVLIVKKGKFPFSLDIFCLIINRISTNLTHETNLLYDFKLNRNGLVSNR